MKDIMTGIVISANGKFSFSGLYDANGSPVSISLEKSDDDLILAVVKDPEEMKKDKPADCGISEEEIDRTCQAQENCNECPLFDYCMEVYADEYDK
jgi:hypothetical protein